MARASGRGPDQLPSLDNEDRRKQPNKRKLRVEKQYKRDGDSHDVSVSPFHNSKYHGIIRATSHLLFLCVPTQVHRQLHGYYHSTFTRRLHDLIPQLKTSQEYPCGFYFFNCSHTRRLHDLFPQRKISWDQLGHRAQAQAKCHPQTMRTGTTHPQNQKTRVEHQYHKRSRFTRRLHDPIFHQPKYHGIIRATSHLCLDMLPHKCINNCMGLTAPLSHTRRLHDLNPHLEISWDYPCGFSLFVLMCFHASASDIAWLLRLHVFSCLSFL